MDILDMIEQALAIQAHESRVQALERTQRRQERRKLREQAEAWQALVAPYREVAREILAHFGLEQHLHRFLSCPDGIAILANCCNCAAKWYDPDLYGHKPELINLVTSTGIECWQESGIVYIETSIGQVSFHALYGEDEGLSEANGREWNGMEMQFNAPLVAKAFLNGWSKYALQQVIELKQQQEKDAA